MLRYSKTSVLAKLLILLNCRAIYAPTPCIGVTIVPSAAMPAIMLQRCDSAQSTETARQLQEDLRGFQIRGLGHRLHTRESRVAPPIAQCCRHRWHVDVGTAARLGSGCGSHLREQVI